MPYHASIYEDIAVAACTRGTRGSCRQLGRFSCSTFTVHPEMPLVASAGCFECEGKQQVW